MANHKAIEILHKENIPKYDGIASIFKYKSLDNINGSLAKMINGDTVRVHIKVKSTKCA